MLRGTLGVPGERGWILEGRVSYAASDFTIASGRGNSLLSLLYCEMTVFSVVGIGCSLSMLQKRGCQG